jgi:hypothetical protein
MALRVKPKLDEKCNFKGTGGLLLIYLVLFIKRIIENGTGSGSWTR